MFAKLRPGHKRSGSTPTSPTPNPLQTSGFLQPPSSSHGPVSATSPSPVESPSPFFFNRVPETGNVHSQPHSESPVSPYPPTLPPIPRVASVYEKRRQEEQRNQQPNLHSRYEVRRETALDRQEEGFANEGLARGDGADQTFFFSTPENQLRRELSDDRMPSAVRTPRNPGDANGSWQQNGAASYESRPGLHPRNHPNSAYGNYTPRRPHEIVSPPPVPLPQDAHQVYSRNTSLQLGGQQPVKLPVTPNSQQRTEGRGKTRLHLLNPMSLLLRRRNGQALEQLQEESLITHRNTSVSPLPDDYDPSIRGKVVHDFNAPRPRRNFSNQSISTMAEGVESRDSSSREGRDVARKESQDSNLRHERQHTPVFKEHFEDDMDQKKNDSAVRAETLANKDFIARNSFPPPDQDIPAPVPPFARTARTVYKPQEQPISSRLAPPVPAQEVIPGTSVAAAPLSPLLEDPVSPLEEENSQSGNVNARNVSTRKPPSARSRATSKTSFDFQSAGLPAHMFSRASRFSFQYANTDSAQQERLLEEKHREKAAAAKAKALANKNREAEEDQSEEEEDEFDYDGMDYDGMEDDVPMVGEDWDYGGGLGVSGMTINGATMNNMMMGMNGLSIQQAAQMALRGNPVSQMQFDPMPMAPVQGLGILQSIEDEGSQSVKQISSAPITMDKQADAAPKPTIADSVMEADDDNFYFDDGAFDDADFDVTEKFDESVLDDPSHPLYERPPVKPPPIPAKSVRRAVPHDSQKVGDEKLPEPMEPMPEHPDPSASIEEVSAYHSALASAASKAFAEGRFAHHDSSLDNSCSDVSSLPNDGATVHDDEEDNRPPNVSSRPSLVPDDGRFSQATTMSPPTARDSEAREDFSPSGPSKSVGFLFPGAYDDPYSSDFDYSDYDSTLEDDPIIAAANAEALANDDEGIYGSEFGFYAKPGAADTVSLTGDAVYGGYFGPKTWGEIKRQRSTREPNLTPITERSEYSTRNSYISLNLADRDRGAPSPGLAALARMSPSWESDMNMETLMKLRRGAWGGSQGSLKSRTGNESSPMNSSPIVPKSDPRALWSSPIAREIPGEEGDDEGDYDELLDEANYEEDEDNANGDWEDASNASSDYSNDAHGPSLGRSHYGFDSPTVRAEPFMPDTPSPVKYSAPRFPSPGFPNLNATAQPQLTPLSPPTTASSTTLTAQTALTTPIPPSPLATNQLSSRPSSIGGSSQPVSPIKAGGHSRSGSDSVAYVKEMDDQRGEFRWVLERRRTGEDGVESLVGRTLVEGGRI